MKKWSCILLSLALTLACCAAFAEETDGDSLTRLGLEAGDAGDYAKTREYWEQAAEKGSARAVADLGYLYENGYGVEKDEAKAMEYYRRAADLGFAGALTEMAYMYSYGLGVEQDYEKAWEYLVKAVDDESTAADACFMLGQLYMGATAWSRTMKRLPISS